MAVLSRLLLTPRRGLETSATAEDGGPRTGECEPISAALAPDDMPHLLTLAQQHHVVVRALGRLLQEAVEDGNHERAEWTLQALESERARIQQALSFLEVVVRVLEDSGSSVTIIKSLDHWPDLGSDLDLFTQARPADVISVMTDRLGAAMAPRSWGDRLACKWNFLVPGLPEPVEVHICRLGQMGEHTTLGDALEARARTLPVGGHHFPVPAAEDRILLATLQRMYRHFYLRLCDVADTAELLEAEPMDYHRLRRSAQAAGIWAGVASYLATVSGYVRHYRGEDLGLPDSVRLAALCDAEQLRFRRGFLRVPLVSIAAPLYASEVAALCLQGRWQATLRLGMLPGLATTAALAQRITGSDKGIW